MCLPLLVPSYATLEACVGAAEVGVAEAGVQVIDKSPKVAAERNSYYSSFRYGSEVWGWFSENIKYICSATFNLKVLHFSMEMA